MSDHYWNDIYALGYQLCSDRINGGLGKTSNLDVLDKSLADQNANLFEFDPYEGTYELRNMFVEQNNPIPPKVRDIAECDLSQMRLHQTFSSNVFPKVITIKVSHALPPNGLLVFNCDHEKSPKLASQLDDVSQPLTEAHIQDVLPGAYLLFKESKLYRVMILGQARERYIILLIDYGIIDTVKLSKLYLMKPEIDPSNIPSGMIITRINGISEIPKNEFVEFREMIDKGKRNPDTNKLYRMKACLRKNENGELIIDFAALNGQKITIGEQLRLTGPGKPAQNDPPIIPYATFLDMQRSNKEDVQITLPKSRSESPITESAFRPPSQTSTTNTKKRIALPPKITNEHHNNTMKSKNNSIFGRQVPINTDLNRTMNASGNGVALNTRKVEQKSNETNPIFGVQEQVSVDDCSLRSLSRRLTPPADKTSVDKASFAFDKTEVEDLQHFAEEPSIDDQDMFSSSSKQSVINTDCSNGMAKIEEFHAQMTASNITEKKVTEQYDGEKTNSSGVDVALSIDEPNFGNISSDVNRLSEQTSICETIHSDQINQEELENGQTPVENNLEAAVDDISVIFRTKIEKAINERDYKAYHMDMITIINMYESAQSLRVKKCFEDLREYAHQKLSEITTNA